MNPFTAYQTAVQSWLSTVENAQSNMLAFQQAVTTIQSYRARALATWWQLAPSHAAAILQASTPGDALAACVTWQGQTLLQAGTLALDTHAARAHLLRTWGRTVGRPSTSTTRPASTSISNTPSSNAAAKPTSATAPTKASQTAHPTPAPVAAAPSTPSIKEEQPAPAAKPAKAPKQRKAKAQTAQSEPESEPEHPQQTQSAVTETAQPQPAQQPQTESTQQSARTTAKVITLPTPEPTPASTSYEEGTHSSTATTFARNSGHSLNASAVSRRTASIPARAGRYRAR